LFPSEFPSSESLSIVRFWHTWNYVITIEVAQLREAMVNTSELIKAIRFSMRSLLPFIL
jgi:hypothetical protein